MRCDQVCRLAGSCESGELSPSSNRHTNQAVSEIATIALWTLIAGIAMPAGAMIARIERIRPAWLEEEFRHFLTALGGGILLAAVALVLIPEGVKHLTIGATALWFMVGGLFFMAIDMLLNAARRPAAQAAAMLADFVPEALALGAVFSSEPALAPLLAVMICLQNLPEGFNAFRELAANSTHRRRNIVLAFGALALLGPAFGLLGYFFLAPHVEILSAIMIFSAGGILYLVFQDIAPQAKLEKHWSPPLGAVLGFLLGLVAQTATHSNLHQPNQSTKTSSTPPCEYPRQQEAVADASAPDPAASL